MGREKIMITAGLSGNCGNNLFIYTVTRMVAEHNNYQFGFNKHPSYDYYGGSEQLYFLNIDYGIENNCGYDELPVGVENIWREKYQHITHPDGDSIDWHEYDPDIWNIKDETKLFIRCCQDARYFKSEKNNIRNWLTFKDDFVEQSNDVLKKENIELDDDTCVINVRGGSEYRSMPDVLLSQKYWNDSIAYMKRINPKMKFICITDDVQYASSIIPYKTYHFSIGTDYFCVANAKYLIMSNSSFAIIPAWLNEKSKYTIAPYGWAKHNRNHWASSHIETFKFNFLDRDGVLHEQ